VGLILFSLTTLGGLLEWRRWALPLEATRWVLLVAASTWVVLAHGVA
jgi:hypothetical protein